MERQDGRRHVAGGTGYHRLPVPQKYLIGIWPPARSETIERRTILYMNERYYDACSHQFLNGRLQHQDNHIL
jgi:hypothetical protein